MTDQELIELVRPYTKSGIDRLRGMIKAVRTVDRNAIAGDIVECGIWRAGNIILARILAPQRTCWLYDTFAGMPMPAAIDRKSNGRSAMESYLGKKKPGGKWSAVTKEAVRGNLIATGTFDEARCRFVIGMVEDTLKLEDNLPKQIALLRLDTDWHSSTKVELEVLYPRLMPGGILIVDDYGHWYGAKKAVDDYFGRNDRRRLVPIDSTAVMLVKQ